MSGFECSITGCSFTTDSPTGMTGHARGHRNKFERTVGRKPRSYDEVRRFFNTSWVPDDFEGDNGRPATLEDFGGDSA